MFLPAALPLAALCCAVLNAGALLSRAFGQSFCVYVSARASAFSSEATRSTRPARVAILRSPKRWSNRGDSSDSGLICSSFLQPVLLLLIPLPHKKNLGISRGGRSLSIPRFFRESRRLFFPGLGTCPDLGMIGCASSSLVTERNLVFGLPSPHPSFSYSATGLCLFPVKIPQNRNLYILPRIPTGS